MPDLAFRLVIGVAAIADRNGILEYDPRRLAFLIAPTKRKAALPLFDRLVESGFLKTFEVGNSTYAYLPDWNQDQDPHPSEAPTCPFPPDPNFVLTPPRCLTAANKKWIDLYPPGLRPGKKGSSKPESGMPKDVGDGSKAKVGPRPDDLSAAAEPAIGDRTGASSCAFTDLEPGGVTGVSQTNPSHPSFPSSPSSYSHPSHPSSRSMGEGGGEHDASPLPARARLFELLCSRNVRKELASAAARTTYLSDDQVAAVVRHMPELLERHHGPKVKHPSALVAHRCARGTILDELDAVRLRSEREKAHGDSRQNAIGKGPAPVPTRLRTQAEQRILEPLLEAFREASGLEGYPHWWDSLEVVGETVLAPAGLWLGENLVEAGKVAGVPVVIRDRVDPNLDSEA